MNEYLKEQIGINKIKTQISERKNLIIKLEEQILKQNKKIDPKEITDEINVLKTEINILKTKIDDIEKSIKEKSKFDIEILNIIKFLFEKNYNKEYILTIIKAENKYKYILIDKNKEKIPKYNSIEFWEEIEKNNIIVLGKTNNKCKNPKDLEKISFYNRYSKKENILEYDKGLFHIYNDLSNTIKNIINNLIIYKYKFNIENIDIEKLFREINIENNHIRKYSKTKKV